MKNGLLCMLVFAGTATALGEIEWERKSVDFKVHPTQLSAKVVFPFKNTGDKPVSIDEVIVTCSCLSTEPLKESYAPGESGTLLVHFDLRERTGKQEKTVYVGIAGEENQTELSFTTDIPENYVFDSKFIEWGADDTGTNKTLRLKNPNKDPIKLLSISSSNEVLPAKLKAIREGFEYEISVERKSVEKSNRSVLRIATEPRPAKSSRRRSSCMFFPT